MYSFSPAHFRGCLFSWLRLAVFASASALPAFSQYTWTTFSVPGAYTIPGAINNNGVVAGTFFASSSQQYSGFVRAANGTVTTFDLPFACFNSIDTPCYAAVTGINDLSQLVGYVVNYAGGTVLAFMRDQSGNVTSLSGPPGVPVWYPVGLTNAGETIAQSGAFSAGFGIFSPIGRASLRSAGGSFTALPQPPGAAPSVFTAINNSGEAAGIRQFCQSVAAACANSTGFVLNLSSGQFTFFPAQTAVASLNDGGLVIGSNGIGVPDITFTGNSAGSILTSFYPVVPEGGSLGDDQPVGINQAGMIIGAFNEQIDQSTGYIGVPSGPSSDTTPPSISLLSVESATAVFSVVDPIAGLSGIGARESNAQFDFSPFSFGQTTPVTVTFRKSNSAEPATITVIAEDTAGLVATFDPAFLTVFGSGELETSALSEIPRSECVLTVTNGDPGLNTLTVRVNGKPLAFALKTNETRTISLKTWMTRESNGIEFSGAGPADSQAFLLLKPAASATASGRAQ